MATETYSISGDTLNGVVDAGSLHSEVEGSSITTPLLGVSTDPTGGDNLYIDFNGTISGAEKTTLDGLVAAHTGEAANDFLEDEPGYSIAVVDRDLTAPPGSPEVGKFWIVGESATGDWAGQDNAIAQWNGANWQFQIPALGFAVYLADEEVAVAWNGSSWGDLSGGTPTVFGTFFMTANSTATSTTTSTAYQTKVTMNTGTLEAGTYLLLVSYGWSGDTTSYDFEAQVLQGQTVLGQIHKQEPKDSGGSNGSTGTDQRHYASRHYTLNLSEGSYTYYLQHRTSRSGNESSMWDAYMSMWRVA